MEKIALVIDSSCDLSLDTLKKENMHMLPLRIIYPYGEYVDKITISSEELYTSLKENNIPTTSLPDMNYVEGVINQLIDQNYTHVIVVTISTQVSGTLNSVRLICEQYSDRLTFHFFDSLTLGYPTGAIGLEVNRLIQEGKAFNDIIESIENIRQRTHGFLTLDTLEFLIKGGRIGKVKGTVGQLLNLRPIISSNDEGLLYTYSTVRGRKKAVRSLLDITKEFLEKGKCKIWVLDGDAKEEAIDFFNSVKDHPNLTHLSLEQLGPATGIHTGPGTLGVCIFEEE